MRKLSLYGVTFTGNRPYWRVDAPKPVGRERVDFSKKEKAEKFFKACQKEFKRTKRVSFLTSPHRLFDAIEATRMLAALGGPWQNCLRRAAALYALCCGEHEKRIGADAKPYTEPKSRGIELHPGLFRALDRIAREKGVDLNDLVAGLAWQFVKAESETKAKRHEYPHEEKLRLRDVEAWGTLDLLKRPPREE